VAQESSSGAGDSGVVDGVSLRAGRLRDCAASERFGDATALGPPGTTPPDPPEPAGDAAAVSPDGASVRAATAWFG
jgi:hypothetical protein